MAYSSGQEKAVEFSLTVEHTEYDKNNEYWRGQVTDLYRDLLATDVDDVRHVEQPIAERKGGAEVIIIALGSAGAIKAAVTVFRAWLARDRDRRIRVTWTEDSKERSVILEADNIAEQTAHELIAEAVRKSNHDD